jgi:hypothetical protein
MAGNRTTFEAAMKRAAEHAWNQHWDQALADYQRAADEFPDDMAARGNLALAFYRLGRCRPASRRSTSASARPPTRSRP